MTPEVSLLLVNWNVTDLLRGCLDSVRRTAAGLSHEVIVVDNASGDADIGEVAAAYPECTFIRNTQNVCTAAYNQARRASRGRYIVILCPDTVLLPGALQCMHAFLRSHPEAGAATATLLNPDGSFQRYYYRLPRLRTVLFCATSYGRLLDRWLLGNRVNRWYRGDDLPEPTEPMLIEQPSLNCIMQPADLFEGEDLIDPRFAYHFNDVDLSRRVRAKGKAIYLLPESRVIHFQGASFRQVARPKSRFEYTVSLQGYFAKHHPAAAPLVGAMLVLNEAVGLLARLARGDREGAALRLRILGRLLAGPRPEAAAGACGVRPTAA